MRLFRRARRTVGGSVRDQRPSYIPLLLTTAALLPGIALGQEAEPYEVSESVTVTDARLRDRPEPERDVPAHVTILDREDLERRDADTLQDVLAGESGIVLFDQVGDDVSKTLDLRGFGGAGTRVFLNGAPLNEPRNNSLALELVPLLQLERVEITRGSTAALAGGGSEGGVINLWTRRSQEFEGSVSAAAGDDSTRDLDGRVANRLDKLDFAVSAALYDTDGFRDNADGDLQRLALDAGWDLDGSRRFDLTVFDANSDFGNPGALTLDEERNDRRLSPFNALDFSDQSYSQASLNFGAVLSEGWTLSANLFARDNSSEVLTTGRSAPLFGGFLLDSDSSVLGSTVQVSGGSTGETGNRLSAGLEWLDGETDAAGFGTSPLMLGSPTGLSSENVADRETLAAYLQDRWRVTPRLTLSGGARFDRDEVAYSESFPDPTNRASREFSELSLRAGLAWSVGEQHSVYTSLGEAFLPPTVEQLFSFPLFGSNPELEPQDSRSVEAGFRGRWRGWNLDAALFRTETEDEIVFDPDSSLGLFGSNVNAGEALRQGLEFSARGELSESVSGFGSLTLMESEFTNGANRGKSLPLVPEERFSLGVEARLPLGLELRAVGLYVGEQVLDNDDSNSAPPLDSYAVVNARLSWSPSAERRFELFVDARNLFDESYATRGIYAFDFLTLTNEIFVTPAPDRRVMGGLEWTF